MVPLWVIQPYRMINTHTSTATIGSMRGTGSEGSAVEGSGDERMNEQSAEDGEHEEEGRDGEQRETAATPQ